MIAEYLKPLTKNELVITNIQQFPLMLSNVPLSEDEKDVSYNVESLFRNIPIKKLLILFAMKFTTVKSKNQSVSNQYLRKSYINLQQNAHLV